MVVTDQRQAKVYTRAELSRPATTMNLGRIITQYICVWHSADGTPQRVEYAESSLTEVSTADEAFAWNDNASLLKLEHRLRMCGI